MEVKDGNSAAADVAYAMSETSFIYPITPSSTMGELIDSWSADGRLNIFGRPVEVRVMQSEGGAAGSVHGALSAGALVSTYTASQGLLLMIPNMYKIAGELMPCVFHVAARAIAGQALSIFGDHTDVMAVRQTGFALLCSHSVQEAHDLAIVAHMATLRSRIPFVHFFEGFRLSHEFSKINTVPYEVLAGLIDMDDVNAHRQRALSPLHPHVRGSAQSPDIFFQLVEAATPFYEKVPQLVQEAMDKLKEITGRSYKLFEYFGDEDAERVVVVMGSAALVVEEVVSYMKNHGEEKIGVLKVHLYRPWSSKHFLDCLPKSVKRIAVLDRVKEAGSLGEPLFLDVVSTLFMGGCFVQVVGGRYGLGSKDFTPWMAKAVFDNLLLDKPKHGFTVGIEDDVSSSSLHIPNSFYSLPIGTTECLFYGFGSDGTVGANRNSVDIIGQNTDMFVQAYFAYDARKSGGVTVSHLRFGPEPLNASYLIKNADFVACHHPAYIFKFGSMTGALKEGGTFLLNSSWGPDEFESKLPAQLKADLGKKKCRFFAIDAESVAKASGMGGRINGIMQAAFFKLSGVLPFEKALELLKMAIAKTYRRKGEEIIRKNHVAIDMTVQGLVEIKVPESWADIQDKKVVLENDDPAFVSRILQPMYALEGDSLPVSTFEPGGIMPMGTTKYEKRGVSKIIANVDMDACIQCGQCSLVCPHAAIRPFLLSEEEKSNAPKSLCTTKAKGNAKVRSHEYAMLVAPLDCTGCAVCTSVCPSGAVQMTSVDDVGDAAAANWQYAMTLTNKASSAGIPRTNVKGSQFYPPLLEFSGACSGCAETPYVKLLTQLFGERMIISNATGCSSIWGGSAYMIPYTVNQDGCGPAWANSLFEDNAEYGYGMCIAAISRRKHLKSSVQNVLRSLPEGELHSELSGWLQNSQDPGKCSAYSESIPKLLEKEMKGNKELSEIYDLRDAFPKISHWIVGGDGWAYDIGYGGLDHVLASGEDVNILVMDTEVYSNTGGQMSKSTPLSAVAKFASAGKRRQKKDLGLMAMTYKDVYVASCAMGANFEQLVRSFNEGEKYSGPSLFLCYCPCLLHGLKEGMGGSSKEQKLAVESGYWNLYRHNPLLKEKGKNPFQLDCKEPTMELKEFLLKENRFAILARERVEEAEGLHVLFSEWALSKRAYLQSEAAKK